MNALEKRRLKYSHIVFSLFTIVIIYLFLAISNVIPFNLFLIFKDNSPTLNGIHLHGPLYASCKDVGKLNALNLLQINQNIDQVPSSQYHVGDLIPVAYKNNEQYYWGKVKNTNQLRILIINLDCTLSYQDI